MRPSRFLSVGRVLAFAGAAASALFLCHTPALASDWPMSRGGPELQGIADMAAPAEAKLAWTTNVGKPVKASAAIAGGKVFLGDDIGIIHALDLGSGKEAWNFKTEGAIEATPLVFGSLVYLGSSDSTLYALETDTGKLKWKYQTGDKILGGANHAKNPKGDGECILIGSYDSNLHCVDAATGQVVWTVSTENYINGSPAVSPTGEVAFGGCDSLVHVIQLSDGKELRQIETDAYIASSIALRDGIGYVGNYGNVVVALDLHTGETKWKAKDREFPYFSSAAVTTDRVVIGGRDKRLHCLDRATGKPVWTFQTRGQVDSSPVICGDAIVVGSQDGRLYCVNLADGKQRWAYEIGAAVTGSPAVADGMIVIGAEDGNVFAFGEITTRKAAAK